MRLATQSPWNICPHHQQPPIRSASSSSNPITTRGGGTSTCLVRSAAKRSKRPTGARRWSRRWCRRPSVIVMESRLPVVDGPAVCEILRRDSLTRTVPILALAADPAESEVERILRAGATSILITPVAADAFVSELRRLAAARDAAAAAPNEAATVDAQPAASATGRKRLPTRSCTSAARRRLRRRRRRRCAVRRATAR